MSFGASWVALRDWACARRDRAGGEGFRAVALRGNRVLRSNARYGPVPLTLVCGWGTGVFSLGQGNGDLRSEGALLGGLRGTGPTLAGIVREVRAFALSRFGEIGCCDPMLATVQSR